MSTPPVDRVLVHDRFPDKTRVDAPTKHLVTKLDNARQQFTNLWPPPGYGVNRTALACGKETIVMKIKCYGRIMGAFVAGYLTTFAAVSMVEAADNSGFVIGPDEAVKITGGPASDAFADMLMQQIVTTLSNEVRGNGVSPNPSIGVWRYSIPPGTGPSMRAHRDADQFLYVVDGRFEFQIGERSWQALPGSLVFIPRKIPHSFKNVDSEPGVLVGGVMPAGFEKYFVK